ncbi:MAG TPA: ABC transporter substrate-binding protein [Thermomicrobiaceae bacterium]|nr:ABC transporter substrate-binding protein [Thermomicrobiaceae bacterium]
MSSRAMRPPRLRLRLTSFGHLAYLPQRVAVDQSYFAAAGLDVHLVPHAGPWTGLIDDLARRRTDLVIGNVWFALQPARHPDALVPIAHCLRQTRFLLCRRPSPDVGPFRWENLAGAVVAVPTDVPTPWVAFREALAVNGVPLDRVRAVVGYDGREAAHDLRAGAVDFAVLDVERAVEQRFKEVAALADAIGPVPWSVYLARRVDVEARPEVYRAFRRANDAALGWIASKRPAGLARFMEHRSALSLRVTRGSIERYRQLDAWPATSAIDPADVARWHDILVRWGLLREPVDWRAALEFADAIDSDDPSR